MTDQKESEEKDPSTGRPWTPFRKEASQYTREAAARTLNLEYGLEPGKEHRPDDGWVMVGGVTEGDHIRAYRDSDVDPDQVPMATDCVQFVLWLASRDSGQLGLRALSPKELEYLGDAAIEWTGEA